MSTTVFAAIAGCFVLHATDDHTTAIMYAGAWLPGLCCVKIVPMACCRVHSAFSNLQVCCKHAERSHLSDAHGTHACIGWLEGLILSR